MYVTTSCDEPHCAEVLAMQHEQKAPSKNLPAGSYLYYEGDTVAYLYLIKSGVVRLTRVLEDGRRQVIAFGYPGDIVGFPASGCHHTDCDALVETRLQLIKRTYLDDAGTNPTMHRALLEAAMHEISAMQDHFMMLGRKCAPEKVASFLKTLVERCCDANSRDITVDLPMSRTDIADFLGLTTETVSRCFTALRKDGVIRLKGVHRVEVLSWAALEARASGDKDGPEDRPDRLLFVA